MLSHLKYKAIILLSCCLYQTLVSQSISFKENLKWGIKENDQIIVPPIYDSVFTFDLSNSLCLVCFKSKSSSANKFIKVTNTNYYCNYLNHQLERFTLRTKNGDTSTVFLLGRNTVKLYSDAEPIFKVAYKNHKYLVRKNFKQITYGDYYDIDLSDEPGFYVAQILNESETPVTGLLSNNETLVIPYEFSGIKVNPSDSLIMVCGAGIRNNSEDYIYDYTGKRKQSYRHHIDLATKQHIIFKVFDPKEHYMVLNIENKEEKELIADEIRFYKKEEILIRLKNTWWIFNLNTSEKTEIKK